MAKLTDYNVFSGRHAETGTVHNALAYQGVTTPHTGKPLSEALLMGISGGAAFGYFTFEYKGYPPHIALLTRNTFDPLETLFERLALPREVLQTTSADKGQRNLLDVLESGRPAIVWADVFSLPHNLLPHDDSNWGMRPVLVYGVEGETAYLADRAGAPIATSSDALMMARARVKKDKFRVVALDQPDLAHLPAAVSKGIWQCISLYTDAPPAGKRESFGLAALEHWAKMLTNTRNKAGWTRYFPPGERLWMALAGNHTQTGAYSQLYNGPDNAAERGMYADFLDEAATLLDKPGLTEAAALFRASEREWSTLRTLLLPRDVPALAETADLLDKKRELFINHGSASNDERREIKAQLAELQAQVSAAWPMSDDEVTAFYARLAEQVTVIHAAEKDAVNCLQSVMA